MTTTGTAMVLGERKVERVRGRDAEARHCRVDIEKVHFLRHVHVMLMMLILHADTIHSTSSTIRHAHSRRHRCGSRRHPNSDLDKIGIFVLEQEFKILGF